MLTFVLGALLLVACIIVACLLRSSKYKGENSDPEFTKARNDEEAGYLFSEGGNYRDGINWPKPGNNLPATIPPPMPPANREIKEGAQPARYNPSPYKHNEFPYGEIVEHNGNAQDGTTGCLVPSQAAGRAKRHDLMNIEVIPVAGKDGEYFVPKVIHRESLINPENPSHFLGNLTDKQLSSGSINILDGLTELSEEVLESLLEAMRFIIARYELSEGKLVLPMIHKHFKDGPVISRNSLCFYTTGITAVENELARRKKSARIPIANLNEVSDMLINYGFIVAIETVEAQNDLLDIVDILPLEDTDKNHVLSNKLHDAVENYLLAVQRLVGKPTEGDVRTLIEKGIHLEKRSRTVQEELDELRARVIRMASKLIRGHEYENEEGLIVTAYHKGEPVATTSSESTSEWYYRLVCDGYSPKAAQFFTKLSTEDIQHIEHVDATRNDFVSKLPSILDSVNNTVLFGEDFIPWGDNRMLRLPTERIRKFWGSEEQLNPPVNVPSFDQILAAIRRDEGKGANHIFSLPPYMDGMDEIDRPTMPSLADVIKAVATDRSELTEGQKYLKQVDGVVMDNGVVFDAARRKEVARGLGIPDFLIDEFERETFGTQDLDQTKDSVIKLDQTSADMCAIIESNINGVDSKTIESLEFDPAQLTIPFDSKDTANEMPEKQQIGLGIVLHQIAEERKRQYAKWGYQDISPEAFLSVASEELGEVAKEINDSFLCRPFEPTETEYKLLRTEWLQLAAVAVQAIQVLHDQFLRSFKNNDVEDKERLTAKTADYKLKELFVEIAGSKHKHSYAPSDGLLQAVYKLIDADRRGHMAIIEADFRKEK